MKPRNVNPVYEFLNSYPPEKENVASNPVYDFLRKDKAKQEAPSESFGDALIRAPGIVGGDLIESAYNAIKSAPEYLDSAKTEIPGFVENYFKHPLHMAGQELAGMAEMGHSLLNTPKSLSDYLANRLHLMSKETADKVPYQKDISGAIKNMLGDPKYEGESLGRGLGRNSLNIIGAESMLNPLKLTSGSLAEDLSRTERRQAAAHSERYNDLFDRANEAGVGMQPLNRNQINLRALGRHASDAQLDRVRQVIARPTLQHSQEAIHDLGTLTRGLENLGEHTLTSTQRDTLTAARQARTNIQNNMFRDADGNVNERFRDEHRQIQRSYAQNVIPYREITHNGEPALQQYRSNKLRPSNLVEAAKKDPFYVQKASSHIPLVLRNNAKKLGISAGTLGAVPLATAIYNKYMGKET
jgi:hypothetical protein